MDVTVKTHNAATGEIVERKMTSEERAQRKTEAEAFTQEQAAAEQARKVALAKLAAIGLTPEDLTALGLAV